MARGQTAWNQSLSESKFQGMVVDLAKLRGWLVYHTFDSRRSQEGFPDLVLVREVVIYAELKSQRGKLSDEQQHWLERLLLAGAHAYVWRPSDWDNIVQLLAPSRPDL